MDSLTDYVTALQASLVFGVSLAIFVTTIVQALKRRFTLPGETPRYIAIAVGTFIGSLYLLYGGAFPAPTDALGFVIPIIAAFVWSFTSPEFYELLKGSASRGTAKTIEQIEQNAVMNAESPGMDAPDVHAELPK